MAGVPHTVVASGMTGFGSSPTSGSSPGTGVTAWVGIPGFEKGYDKCSLEYKIKGAKNAPRESRVRKVTPQK